MTGQVAQVLPLLRDAMLHTPVDFTEDAPGVISPVGDETMSSTPMEAAVRSFAGNIFTMMPQMPERAVRPGDQWNGQLTTRMRTPQLSSDSDFRWTYTLRRVVGTSPALVAEIDVAETSTVHSQGFVPDQGAAGSGRGRIRYALDSGEVLEAVTAGDLSMPGAPSHHEFELRARLP